ncbi:MAG TPA: hypothetical protein VKI61_19970 [Chitinophagaceae bacterium]|jgi:hypothetical protein|nr:hypothetical protein [Chitinophagaceae bacterium]
MKKQILLKQFTHTILPSAVIAAKELTTGSEHYPNDPLALTVDIDFEKGNVKLEGDWHFMMTCNRDAEPAWFNYHTGKVCIEAGILPSSVINLADEKNDGVVFVLEGNIKDISNNVNACFGLLVLNKIAGPDKMKSGLWHICFYLYDNSNEECEIAFKLPVYVSRSELVLN